MILRKLRHGVEYVAYVVAQRLFGFLPLSVVRRLGLAAGRVYFVLGRDRRRTTLEGLGHALPAERERHVQIARDSFRHAGATFFESAHAYGRDPVRFRERFEIRGEEHLEAALALGKGLVIATGHYGNFELSLWPLGQRLGEIHVVARPMSNPLVDRDVQALRSRLGHATVEVKSAGFRLLKALRRGQHVALVFDQRVKSHNGILIPFLGQPAWLTPMVAALSIHAQAPVVPVFCVPEGADRYVLQVLPAILPEGKGIDAEVAMTRRYLEPLEERIRQEPALWLWMHRLWRRTLCEGQPKRLALNWRMAGLSPDEAVDVGCVPERLRAELGELGTSDFLEQAKNAVIVADDETGSLCARAVAEGLLRLGHRVRLPTAAELARELVKARKGSELGRSYRELDVNDLLIVRDLGGEALDEEEAEALVLLVEQRCGRRSTLLTTPLAVEEWGRVFGEKSMETLRHCFVEDAALLESG